ncbi:hypothetical protein K0M31_003826 [Melipona bicolor]|uniref:Receptor ligand binding region domain-containing protein n=1 Tax=Melipona bicolor TaxID=60889 RepID=A0AA40FXP8_9HYME|nr:hypothetical protein K0M31_003826 [Melipona bicolor]
MAKNFLNYHLTLRPNNDFMVLDSWTHTNAAAMLNQMLVKPNKKPTQNRLPRVQNYKAAAYVDLVKAWGWKSFTIIYENNEGLVRLQELLKAHGPSEFPITVRQLSEGSEYRAPLKHRWLIKTAVAAVGNQAMHGSWKLETNTRPVENSAAPMIDVVVALTCNDMQQQSPVAIDTCTYRTRREYTITN